MLQWNTVLHLIHNREATSTILQQIIRYKLKASPDVLFAIADLLDKHFSDAELRWDLSHPFLIGGGRLLRNLAAGWHHVEKYCSRLVASDPQFWTIAKQEKFLAADMKVLGAAAPYLRFHNFRQTTLSAPLFGSPQTPEMGKTDC